MLFLTLDGAGVFAFSQRPIVKSLKPPSYYLLFAPLSIAKKDNAPQTLVDHSRPLAVVRIAPYIAGRILLKNAKVVVDMHLEFRAGTKLPTTKLLVTR